MELTPFCIPGLFDVPCSDPRCGHGTVEHRAAGCRVLNCPCKQWRSSVLGAEPDLTTAAADPVAFVPVGVFHRR